MPVVLVVLMAILDVLLQAGKQHLVVSEAGGSSLALDHAVAVAYTGASRFCGISSTCLITSGASENATGIASDTSGVTAGREGAPGGE
jgi:hypothetical protein